MNSSTSVSHLDPFSREFLLDPYACHAQMHAAPGAFWLEKYAVWGMARHSIVHATLTDFRNFCSSAGVGLSDFRKQAPWRAPSLLLETDPPLHTRTRGVIGTVLSRRAMNALRPTLEAEARRLVDQLLERRHFDAIPDLAEAYPLKVFPDAVGINPAGRENLLPYGNMAFNAFGPRNELLQESMQKAQSVIAWVTSSCQRDALDPEGLGAQIYAQADAGKATEAQAALLVRSLLTAGVDTTVNAIGNAMLCFARYPESWAKLKENPACVHTVIDEVIRFESPVQTFFRTTTQDVVIDGVPVTAGSKVLMFLGAANRDPQRWERANEFDVTRNASGHVGFGAGIHVCVGQMMARLEVEILLTELVTRVERIETAGEPVPRVNNTLRGWESLPVRVQAS